jgi:Arc/MetJ-type ribon-helix-helix transcriptional regulator
MCYTFELMKSYIHARLGEHDRDTLDELKKKTGQTESELVRRGLRLVAREERRRRSALDLAGRSVGRFRKGPHDLSTNRKHLEGFGK